MDPIERPSNALCEALTEVGIPLSYCCRSELEAILRASLGGMTTTRVIDDLARHLLLLGRMGMLHAPSPMAHGGCGA